MNSFKEFYESQEIKTKKKKRKKSKKLDKACWDGYEAIGTKTKNGKEVPNCVPVKTESFKDFYNVIEDEQLDEEMINEDAATVVLAVLGLPSIVALFAWVGSIMFTAYFRGIGRLTSKVIEMWKNLFKDFRNYITKDTAQEAVRDLAQDPKAREQYRETEKNKRAFNTELKEVYSAIERKDFDLAKEEFNKTPKYIQNNPDVHKVIISEISRVLGEPPIYVSSPGNDTYRAIKKIINIRVAKAAAYATKMALGKNLKNSAPINQEQGKEQDTEETEQEEE